MKIYSTIFVLFVSLLLRSECGVIDNAHERVKNTTIAMKDHMKNWVDYGKDFVFGHENKTDIPEKDTKQHEEANAFGEMVHEVKDKISAARKKVHDAILGEEDKCNRGVFKNMYDGMKNRIHSVKNYVFGDDKDEKNKDETNCGDKNQVGKETENAVPTHNVITEKTNNLSDVQIDLRGMDIEKTSIRSSKSDINDFKPKVEEKFNQEQEKIKNGVHDAYEKSKKSLEDNTKDYQNSFKNTVAKNQNKLNEMGTKFQDKISESRDALSSSVNDFENNLIETSNKEKELLDNVGDKFRDGAKKVKDHASNYGEGMKELSYS